MLCSCNYTNRKCPPPSAKYPKIHSASAQMGGNGFSRNALRPFLMSINPCGLKPRQVNTFAEWIYGHKTTELVVQRNYFWPFGPSEAMIFGHLATKWRRAFPVENHLLHSFSEETKKLRRLKGPLGAISNDGVGLQSLPRRRLKEAESETMRFTSPSRDAWYDCLPSRY